MVPVELDRTFFGSAPQTPLLFNASRSMLLSLAAGDFASYILQGQQMRRAIYPGTFDPITMGHLDIIERSSKLFDEVVVALLLNMEKQPMFSTDERVAMIREIIPWTNVTVGTFEGLLVHYAVQQQAQFVVRGIRAISDYEYELQMALMNRRLEPSVETVFLMAGEAYSYISSRLIKEVFKLGGSIKGLVPELVEKRMRDKIGSAES